VKERLEGGPEVEKKKSEPKSEISPAKAKFLKENGMTGN
jgi:hypothetical protein